MPAIGGLGLGSVKKVSGVGVGAIRKVSGLGLGILWRLLLPGGMDKSGTYTLPSLSTWTKITGWAARSGYGDTVITADSLIIQGSGVVTVTFKGTFSPAFGTQQFQPYLNGVAIGTAANSGVQSAVANVSVAHGDTLALYGFASTYRTVSAESTNTYIYFTPS